MGITDPAAFIEALLAEPEFRREVEEISTTYGLEIDPEELESADWRNPLFPLTYALARRNGRIE